MAILSFIPAWAILALLAALCSAILPLVQERVKVDGLALAYMVKLVTVFVTLPLMLANGLPDSWAFYLLLALSSGMYCVSDAIYFRAVVTEGAGIVARLLPVPVIGTFFLWFLVDPSLIGSYLARPLVSCAILAVISAAAFFAVRLKKCPVTTRAARAIWFLLVAATVGPVMSKMIFATTPAKVALPAYLCLQSVMMVGFWTLHGLARGHGPQLKARLLDRRVIVAGIVTGLISAAMIALKNYAYTLTDNPAYPNVLYFTDSVWILLIYKAMGRRSDGDIRAGLGMVACAAALVILKAL